MRILVFLNRLFRVLQYTLNCKPTRGNHMENTEIKMAFSAISFVLLSASVLLFLIGAVTSTLAGIGVIIAGFFMAIAIVLPSK